MMSYINILLMAFVFFTGETYSQTLQQHEEDQDLIALNQKLSGTWQIQMVGTRAQPMIPFDLVRRVDAIRSKNEVKYFYIDPKIRIKVLSFEQINSPGFIPVKRIISIGHDEVNK